MNTVGSDEKRQSYQLDETSRSPGKYNPERHLWRNWFLLASVAFITTIGLVTALPPLLSERMTNPWPWEKTDVVLLAGLSLIVLAFIGYLTRQQQHVTSIQRQLHRLEEDKKTQILRHASRLQALLAVSRKMCSEVESQCVFDSITDICIETFKCYRASLMLLEKDSGELVVRSASGELEDNLIGARLKLGDGIAGWVAEEKKAVLLNRSCDLAKYPGLVVKNLSSISAMVVPVILRDELVGVLNVSTMFSDADYDEEDFQALRVFAEDAGIFIRHSEHTQWMRKRIENLERASKKKDPYEISPTVGTQG